MKNVLILAGATGGELVGERAGDLFDMALVDAVRTLDVPAGAASVLVPWSTDLCPLIAAGIIDTGPSFDPESGARVEDSRSGLIPYLPPGAEWSESSMAFFTSSHLSLDGDAPIPFEQAIRQHPPTHVVVLAWTKEFSHWRDLLAGARLFTFGSMAPPEQIASGLNIPSSRVENLEARLPRLTEDRDIPEGSEFADDRARENRLEPFVPFSLLIQDALSELLPDDEPPISPARRS
jgi:hypothetical protein